MADRNWFIRTITHDMTKRAAAGVAASLLVAGVMEAFASRDLGDDVIS